MQIKHPSKFYERLEGLPGLEERLYHENRHDPYTAYHTYKSPQTWTIMTFGILSIASLFLPLTRIDNSGTWQKIYYIGIVVSLREHVVIPYYTARKFHTTIL